MSAFEEHVEELEKYEQMFGKERGRLAVSLDRITNALVLTGQHGVYCTSQRNPAVPAMDLRMITQELTHAKELIQSVMEEMRKARNGAQEWELARLLQKGIGVAFVADGGAGAVAGMDDGGIGELHDFVFEGGNDVVVGAAPKIGAADAAGKKRVTGKKLWVGEGGIGAIGGKVERDAAGSVAGSVHDIGEEIAPLERVALFKQLVNFDDFGSGHAEEGGLHFHAAIEREIVVVHHDGRAGVLVKLGEAADVIDVRVGADDGLDGEFVAAEEAEDAFDFVAGIDDDALEGAGIADDGAVALKHANGDLEVDHFLVGGVGQAVRWMNLAHGESISLGRWRLRG